MKVTLRSTDNDVVSLQCEGKITQADFQPGADVLLQAAGEEVYHRRALLDLGRCESLDSCGIGWLVTCHKRFKTAGGRLVLHSVPQPILQVLQVHRLDPIFFLAGNEDGARRLATEARN
jgi:anti-anti-sigma factor